jgi:D-beta-D-heptose 7-phosphate kinase/D-beta-D-heptose 1-phosphate adenosyltransferase
VHGDDSTGGSVFCFREIDMSKPKVLVIGDVMLDCYLHGNYTRPNPEGNGRVFLVDREEYRLGGAASVAMLAQSLGADTWLIGVVGDDFAGRKIRQLCKGVGVSALLATEADRMTTLKERRVENGSPLTGRTDRETSRPICGLVEKQLVDAIASQTWDCVLISDYAKGCLSKRALGAAGNVSWTTIVDPGRGVPWDRYPPRAMIKANLAEAREALGRPNASARELVEKWQRKNPLIVTAGGDGIYYTFGGEASYVPGLDVPVVDVCGAGDTVLAAFAVTLLSGSDFREACEFANRAASLQVQQLGVAAVHIEQSQPQDVAV